MYQTSNDNGPPNEHTKQPETTGINGDLSKAVGPKIDRPKLLVTFRENGIYELILPKLVESLKSQNIDVEIRSIKRRATPSEVSLFVKYHYRERQDGILLTDRTVNRRLGEIKSLPPATAITLDDIFYAANMVAIRKKLGLPDFGWNISSPSSQSANDYPQFMTNARATFIELLKGAFRIKPPDYVLIVENKLSDHLPFCIPTSNIVTEISKLAQNTKSVNKDKIKARIASAKESELIKLSKHGALTLKEWIKDAGISSNRIIICDGKRPFPLAEILASKRSYVIMDRHAPGETIRELARNIANYSGPDLFDRLSLSFQDEDTTEYIHGQDDEASSDEYLEQLGIMDDGREYRKGKHAHYEEINEEREAELREQLLKETSECNYHEILSLLGEDAFSKVLGFGERIQLLVPMENLIPSLAFNDLLRVNLDENEENLREAVQHLILGGYKSWTHRYNDFTGK